LEQSRLQGVLKGTPGGETILDKIMNDEQVQPGERVLTSGGDEIFPKGLLVGTVAKAVRGPDSFLSIKVKPAADLSRLEEVLVITGKEERQPQVAGAVPRAVDILAERLPSVPDKPATGEHTAGDVAPDTLTTVNKPAGVDPGSTVPQASGQPSPGVKSAAKPAITPVKNAPASVTPSATPVRPESAPADQPQ